MEAPDRTSLLHLLAGLDERETMIAAAAAILAEMLEPVGYLVTRYPVSENEQSTCFLVHHSPWRIRLEAERIVAFRFEEGVMTTIKTAVNRAFELADPECFEKIVALVTTPESSKE